MGTFDLMRHRLAEIVQEGGPLHGLDAGLELGRHHAREVDHLEGVLEHVLAIARAIPQATHDLDELGMQLAAVRLEDRLLACLDDVLLELGLRLVIHLLDPGRVDATVLDQLSERDLGHLAADAVEGGENDRVRRVVDDDVDSGQALESANVTAFAADDPALHVVRGKLDHRDRRLGSVTRRHALQGIGDEVARASLRFQPGLLLELPDVACELVPDQLV